MKVRLEDVSALVTRAEAVGLAFNDLAREGHRDLATTKRMYDIRHGYVTMERPLWRDLTEAVVRVEQRLQVQQRTPFTLIEQSRGTAGTYTPGRLALQRETLGFRLPDDPSKAVLVPTRAFIDAWSRHGSGHYVYPADVSNMVTCGLPVVCVGPTPRPNDTPF